MRFFHILTGSFYSAPLYAQARQRADFGLLYSLLLVLVTTAITLTVGFLLFHQLVMAPRDNQPPLFDDLIHQVAQQMPVMALDNNQLHTKDPRAFTIHLRGSVKNKTAEGNVITIDTTGGTTVANMPTPILITTNEVIIKNNKKTEIKPLSEYTKTIHGPIAINHALVEDLEKRIIASVHSHLGEVYAVLGLITWFFYALFAYILRIFILLALGVGGLVLSLFFGVRMSYASAVTLAAISYTPVVVIELILLFATSHPVGTMTSFLLGLIMLAAAIWASRDEPLAAAQ